MDLTAFVKLSVDLLTLSQHSYQPLALPLISTLPSTTHINPFPFTAGTGGSAGSFAIVGLQIGEVFVGVQPLLGVLVPVTHPRPHPHQHLLHCLALLHLHHCNVDDVVHISLQLDALSFTHLCAEYYLTDRFLIPFVYPVVIPHHNFISPPYTLYPHSSSPYPVLPSSTPSAVKGILCACSLSET